MNKNYKKYKIYFSKVGKYPTIMIDGKTILLHVYVWEEKNGSKPKGFHIHHIDHVKNNYSLKNLELVSIATHRKIHAGWTRDKKGKWIEKSCNGCSKKLPFTDFYISKKGKYHYICKKCTSLRSRYYNKKPEAMEKHKLWARKWRKEHRNKC